MSQVALNRLRECDWWVKREREKKNLCLCWRVVIFVKKILPSICLEEDFQKFWQSPKICKRNFGVNSSRVLERMGKFGLCKGIISLDESNGFLLWTSNFQVRSKSVISDKNKWRCDSFLTENILGYRKNGVKVTRRH